MGSLSHLTDKKTEAQRGYLPNYFTSLRNEWVRLLSKVSSSSKITLSTATLAGPSQYVRYRKHKHGVRWSRFLFYRFAGLEYLKESFKLLNLSGLVHKHDAEWGLVGHLLPAISCRQDSGHHDLPWVPKSRSEQLLIKVRTAWEKIKGTREAGQN